jgi:circadian clock protein KaiC
LAQSSAKEPGLMLGFYETPQRLYAKARSIGLDLERLVKKGHVEIIWHSQGENILDELGHDLLKAVGGRKVKRLVIDGLGGMIESIPYPERIGRYMACLMNELRARDVTALMTMESSEIVGPNVRLPITGVSALIENLIFLRFVERNASLSRLISVAKMRNSDYDQHVREFAITERGVEVGDPLFGMEGSITGIARRARQSPTSKRSATRRAKKK